MVKRDDVPRSPGVYLFKDKEKNVLYVGKAINLKARVAQYFSSSVRDQKTLSLVSRIVSLDTTVVESELEALILEANLIKKYLPPYNIRLTDDKDYLYIYITKERFPRIMTGRKKELLSAKKYFGPFPSSKTTRNTLKQLRKVFTWCAAPESKRPCFYYHLGLCPGACIGMISQKDYNKIINRFSKFMEGKKNQLIEELSCEMKKMAENQMFEEAGKIKKILEGVSYITSPNRANLYLENPNFLEEENKQAVINLKEDLKLSRLPSRIEGYDISNIQGGQATGSMVVLTYGDIDKSQYRKFKIRISGKPNDVAMHAEMMRRRLNHPEWSLPDLIIVDGGIAQVRAAFYEIQKFKYQIPVYGLAKRMEWLYSPGGEIIKLPRRSLSLKLLQKLRDEAHRFAVNYHRKLRSKAFLKML